MFVMYFDILDYLIIALGSLSIFIALFILYKSYIRSYISKMFYYHEDDDELTYEEKYKRYIEKKQRELLKNQMLAKDITKDYVQFDSNVKVVDIMDPIGPWTKLIMSEKLQRFAGLRFDKNQTGFWQMFVSMRSLSQGKHRGRSK